MLGIGIGIGWIIAVFLYGNSAGTVTDQASGTERVTSSMVEYKVVFWFDGTAWRSQAYEIRKGEYTAAVDEWVKRIEFDAFGFARPGRMATVRQISLPETPVESFPERRSAAIRDELERTLRGSRVPPRRSMADSRSFNPTPVPAARARPRSRPDPGPRSIRLAPVTPPQPFPYPYPRPHP